MASTLSSDKRCSVPAPAGPAAACHVPQPAWSSCSWRVPLVRRSNSSLGRVPGGLCRVAVGQGACPAWPGRRVSVAVTFPWRAGSWPRPRSSAARAPCDPRGGGGDLLGAGAVAQLFKPGLRPGASFGRWCACHHRPVGGLSSSCTSKRAGSATMVPSGMGSCSTISSAVALSTMRSRSSVPRASLERLSEQATTRSIARVVATIFIAQACQLFGSRSMFLYAWTRAVAMVIPQLEGMWVATRQCRRK